MFSPRSHAQYDHLPSTTIHLAQAFPHPKTNPTSVAFYDIPVGNEAGLFFQQLLAQARTGQFIMHM